MLRLTRSSGAAPWLTALVLLLSLGCDTLTELVVSVDTDLMPPTEIDRIRLEIDGFGRQPIVAGLLPGTPLPVMTGLVHEGGPLGPISITATGLRDFDVVVLERRARVFFIEDSVRLLRIDLLRSCIGVECPDGMTCGETGCRPIEVDPTELDVWAGPQTRLMSTDAGPDAVSDAMDSSPMDSSRPDVIIGPRDSGADTILRPVFDPPTVIYSDPSELIDDPTLTDDMLELYFNRQGDIWVMTRASVADAWGTPRVVSELSTSDSEGPPEIHPAGLIMLFTSGRPGGLGGSDVWRSTRASRGDVWQTPTHVPDLSTTGGDVAPAFTESRLRAIVGVLTMTTGYDLFESVRASVGDPWPGYVPLTELNTTSADSNAAYSPDGLTIVFDSDRAGALGQRDFYLASRPSLSAPFGPPRHLVEISSPSFDEDPWISRDLRTIVFTSNRSGQWALYEAHR